MHLMRATNEPSGDIQRRIVVKIGTGVLSAADGTLDNATLERLVAQIVSIQGSGSQVVLVTSGAVGSGRSLVRTSAMDKIAEKQVFAAVGQIALMSSYAAAFRGHGQLCAQVLVTKEDFRDKTHYLNMRTCFENLLQRGIVPIVNENDVVATTELLFTDNDELAGLVASQLNVDALAILTTVEGFLKNTSDRSESDVVPVIDMSTIGEYEEYVAPHTSAFGRGGMLTKFNIAKKLMTQGITVYFANGKRTNVLVDLIAGKSVGTKFLPRGRSSSIKRRVAHSEGFTKGAVKVNVCTTDLLLSKTKIMSLLPVGIVSVTGSFEKGDIIEIISHDEKKLGFGIAQYDAAKAKELMGKKGGRPVIHYNHMFING